MGRNSVKNCLMVTKEELDLDIFMMNLYANFHFNICISCKDIERKLSVIGNFVNQGGVTLSKIV